LINSKGPVGLSTLATAVSESTNNRRGYEPSYSRRIYYENTKRSRVTDKAYRHLGKVNRTFKVVCFKFIKYALI
jgi:Holliday junction resolvasome RuvABC ATP-dependent DNA helicase subunit